MLWFFAVANTRNSQYLRIFRLRSAYRCRGDTPGLLLAVVWLTYDALFLFAGYSNSFMHSQGPSC